MIIKRCYSYLIPNSSRGIDSKRWDPVCNIPSDIPNGCRRERSDFRTYHVCLSLSAHGMKRAWFAIPVQMDPAHRMHQNYSVVLQNKRNVAARDSIARKGMVLSSSWVCPRLALGSRGRTGEHAGLVKALGHERVVSNDRDDPFRRHHGDVSGCMATSRAPVLRCFLQALAPHTAAWIATTIVVANGRKVALQGPSRLAPHLPGEWAGRRCGRWALTGVLFRVPRRAQG
jgi:hypothetical protein